MKRLQQLVSCYLAFCLACAGAVGFSPVLHFWIEHGGQGPAHLHHAVSEGVAPASHGPLSHHGRLPPPNPARADTRLNGLIFHSQDSVRVPTIPLQRAWYALIQLLEVHGPAAPAPSSPEGDPGHEHHSLPQLLAGGLIDLHLDLPPLQDLSVSRTLHVPLADTPLLVRDWDVPTLGRGPPSVRS